MEYRILGPLEIADDGRPVVLTARKQRALLLCLLLRGNEVVSADALADAVWGEHPPASAAKLVQVYVSQLRRTLGEGAIETRPPGYVMRVEPEQLDAGRFERLLADGREAMAAGNPALAASLWRRGARALARARARGRRPRRLRGGRGRPPGGAAPGVPGGARRCGPRAGTPRGGPGRARRAGRRASAARTPARAAHAGAVSLRPAGRRPRRLPRRRPRPARRARPGAGRAAARSRARDPQPGPVARRARAARTPGTAIPVPSSALVGRRRELRALTAMVTREDIRIVTVSGAGGSGKTRVALEIARTAGPQFANGAAFVELAAVRDPASSSALWRRRSARPRPPRSTPRQSLARWLADARVAARGRQLRARRDRGRRAGAAGGACAAHDGARHEPPGAACVRRARLRARARWRAGRRGGALRRAGVARGRDAASTGRRGASARSAGASTACRSRSSWRPRAPPRSPASAARAPRGPRRRSVPVPATRPPASRRSPTRSPGAPTC